jgi:hypothetical protein
MQLPSRISIGPEKVMDAIAGALKAAFRQGQKSCPQTPELLSKDTSVDKHSDPEIGGNPSSRRPSKTQQTRAFKQQNLMTSPGSNDDDQGQD